MSIKKLAFQIKEPKSKPGYKVRVLFFKHKKAKTKTSTHYLGKKKLVILPGERKPELQSVPVLDVYSFNGMIDSNMSSKDCNQFWQQYDFDADLVALNKIKPHIVAAGQENVSQVVFVLDIKSFTDDVKGYADVAKIKQAELAFMNHLKQVTKPDSTSFLGCLLDLNLQFVLLEGGLKADLIASGFFTEEEKEFLQTDSEGCKDFCQLIEFMLNAFKRGESVTISFQSDDTIVSKTFLPETYIVKVNETGPDYQPTTNSTTYYPPCYHEIAMKGRYTQALQNSTLFKCTTQDTSENVVVMQTVHGGSYAV